MVVVFLGGAGGPLLGSLPPISCHRRSRASTRTRHSLLHTTLLVSIQRSITAIFVWGRWRAWHQAWEYAVPGPNWELT